MTIGVKEYYKHMVLRIDGLEKKVDQNKETERQKY
jgi:hypothetical protein